MRFKDTSNTKPGYTVHEADDPNTGYHYVIQKKNTNTGDWLVAVRQADDEPLRIIYATTTLTDAKKYVKTYRTRTNE